MREEIEATLVFVQKQGRRTRPRKGPLALSDHGFNTTCVSMVVRLLQLHSPGKREAAFASC